MRTAASLYLDVAATGSRRWLYRYRAGEKVKDMALGDATIVTLADARALRDKWRRELALGNDPTETRRVEKAAGVTFGEVADRVLKSQRIKSLSNPKHRDQWRYSLTELAEALRSRSIADVATSDILGILRPLWASGKHETASRLRSRVELVIEVGRSEGAIPDDKPNVARWRNHIELHAPRSEAVKEHHAALPYRDAPAFMAWLRDKDSVSARALEFTILTAARTGETLFAAAAEIDFEVCHVDNPGAPHEGSQGASRASGRKSAPDRTGGRRDDVSFFRQAREAALEYGNGRAPEAPGAAGGGDGPWLSQHFRSMGLRSRPCRAGSD